MLFKHIQRVSDDVSISDTDYDSIDTSTYSNVDVVKTTIFSSAEAGTTSWDGMTKYFNSDATELSEVAQADIDLTESIGKYYWHTDKTLWIIVEKATYADITAARTGLGTTTINYQLETEIETTLDVFIIKKDENGLSAATELETYESGSYIISPIAYAYEQPVADVITLTTDGTLVDLSHVYRNDGTDESPVWEDVTDDCSLDTNTGEVTITGADNTKYYYVVADIAQEESTNPESIFHYEVENGYASDTLKLDAGTYTISNWGSVDGSLTIKQIGEVDVILSKGEFHTLTLGSTEEIVLSTDLPMTLTNVEENTYPTPWHLGEDTRASENCYLTLPKSVPEEFGIGVFFKAHMDKADATSYDTDKCLFSLYADSNNYINGNVSSSDGEILFNVCIAGNNVSGSTSGFLYSRNDIIGVFLHKENTGYTGYVYNATQQSEIIEVTIADITALPNITNIYLGQENNTKHINTVLFDFVFQTDNINYETYLGRY